MVAIIEESARMVAWWLEYAFGLKISSLFKWSMETISTTCTCCPRILLCWVVKHWLYILSWHSLDWHSTLLWSLLLSWIIGNLVLKWKFEKQHKFDIRLTNTNVSINVLREIETAKRIETANTFFIIGLQNPVYGHEKEWYHLILICG